jgi:hypothetical protein
MKSTNAMNENVRGSVMAKAAKEEIEAVLPVEISVTDTASFPTDADSEEVWMHGAGDVMGATIRVANIQSPLGTFARVLFITEEATDTFNIYRRGDLRRLASVLETHKEIHAE